MLLLLTILNGLAFIFYGILVLTTNHMINEFERYKLIRYRSLAGVLEVLGGTGCIIGFYFNDFIFVFACGGLALLMTIGTIVRVRVSDSIVDTFPAIVLGLLNYYLVYTKIKSGIGSL